jgi:uncharacterized membrane protein YhhN
MTNTFIIIFGIIFLCGLLFYEKKKSRVPLLIAKAVLSLLFVMTALLQPRSVPGYYQYLLLGLIFCLIGDVCLALPKERTFKVGLVAFLIAHVFYIFTFLSLIPIFYWISPGHFIFLGTSTFIFFWLRPHLKSMLIPVLLYIVVITVMVIGAWAVFWKSSFRISGKALILGGALCFYFSDVFVARDRFVKEEYLNRFLGLPLYYASQFMLAFSIGLL